MRLAEKLDWKGLNWWYIEVLLSATGLNKSYCNNESPSFL
jgi:hypothetical protein